MQKIRMKKISILINKGKSTALKQFNDPKAFTEYSNHMQKY